MIKADLHVHTNHSPDCLMSIEQIIKRCIEQQINCIAIADHGTIEGALKIKKIAPFKVIVAQEVDTSIGEIMGMFISEEIPNKSPVNEAIRRIRDQGGLVCIPHPGDFIRPSAISFFNLSLIIADVDIIEAFNARNYLPGGNNRSKNIAKKYHKLCSAGSDAHTPLEIGNVHISMPDFVTKDDFLISLQQGVIHGQVSNPFVHIRSTGNKLIKRFSF